MPNDGSGETVQQQPVDQTPNVESVILPVAPKEPPSIETQPVAKRPEKTEIQKIEDRVKRAEWWMIWLTAAIAFSGFCAVGVGYMQWREIHAGSTETHDLAVAAKTQADKMKSMSEAAEKIQKAAEGMVAQDQRIADNAKNTLDASNKQSRAALDATIAQNRLEERPWIGIGMFSVSKFEEKKPIIVDVEIINSGKTPAIHVEQWIHYKFSTISNLAPMPTDLISSLPHPVGSIPPQGHQIIHIYLPWDTWTHNLPWLTTKSVTLSFFGEISYEDVAGVRHRTQLCIFMNDADARALAFCDGWNDMN